MAARATMGDGVATGPHAREGLHRLTLAALGVVFGDIGTSPLYTMREAFGHAGGLHAGEPAVLGVLSLVFWSLMLVVTAQIRRADPARRQSRRGRRAGAGHAGRARGAGARRRCAADPGADASPAWRCSTATA